MDQDFHYYGTFHSAMCAGFDNADATLIAKASNFIDFFHEGEYNADWSLVSETKKSAHYTIIAKIDKPRYTFQHGYWDTFKHPEDSVWCAYHFIPGNYDDPAGTPSREDVHGATVADYLPRHIRRDTRGGEYILRKYNPGTVKDLEFGQFSIGRKVHCPESWLRTPRCAQPTTAWQGSSAWPQVAQRY